MSVTGNRKEEIHAAAARLFGEKGFAASSVRDIAQAVGLGAASLYNHMGSKDDLLIAICFRCAEAFSGGMRDIESSCSGPEEKIKALIRLHIRIALQDKSSVTVFNDEWRHLPEPYLSAFKAARRSYEINYLRIVQEGMETGVIKDMDPYLVYQHILSSLRWLHQPGARKTTLTEQAIGEQITTFLINGIGR